MHRAGGPARRRHPAGRSRTRDDIVDVLAKCTDVTDREARIECYDRAAPQLRAAAGLPAAVPSMPAQAPLPVQAAAAPQPRPRHRHRPSGQSFLGSLDPFGEAAVPAAPLPAQMAYQPIGQELLPITIGVTDYDAGARRPVHGDARERPGLARA
ncbi:MAG: hypothetical protein WDM81_09165 [Rhizomicrobium sp.]